MSGVPACASPDLRPRRSRPPRLRWPRPKDPFPAWSHWVGVLLSVTGTVVLLVAAAGKPLHLVGFAVYGLSMVLLYVASALAHSLDCSHRNVARLERFDYIAIFLLIAGTYTPLCLVSLRGPWGWGLLAAAWATAAFGITSLFLTRPGMHWPRVATYVVMGWLALFAAPEIIRVLPRPAILLLIAGGVVYSLGALVFLTQRPRLWPGRFGSHDLWHCMVLAGSACHFAVMLRYVAPAP